MVELNNKVLVGVLASAFIVTLLLTPTSYLTSQGVSFIDTELREATPNKQFVQTTFDLAQKDQLYAIPTKLGDWKMTRQENFDKVAEILKPEVLLARQYVKPGVYQPLSLVIVESKNMSSFHPAPVCFTFQGYTILDEGSDVTIPSLGTPWARAQWLENVKGGVYKGEIPAKRLIVSHSTNNFTEYVLAVYFYIKNEAAAGDGGVTWVRVTVPIPTETNFQGQLELAQELLGEVVPSLFHVRPADQPLLLAITSSYGAAGGVVAVGLAAAPIGVVGAQGPLKTWRGRIASQRASGPDVASPAERAEGEPLLQRKRK